ncbi:hypothetical protein EDI_168320 [Entamoeba dispar SAW760]|uniref:Uncharacterized protein n=1 Tax=Entamoeba dispar (strain ATCC PRA-260 / SAW760) TaxID=370354 RepID=B0E9D8_ENTDS|nr:uncharacterized protein EDI_168320 [Entamoeba dispar SAW760]EDR28847.1 hypothetical protein EDI_168320 [Entamoeba dispar SAW760]|eukprot:EDR28847.1 hypothetical protein EDI_168320 [Entamoeba dispar SAW760]
MSDPSVNEETILYLNKTIDKIKNQQWKQVIKEYIGFVIEQSKNLSWSEFEYCVVLPFKMIKDEQISVFIKFPKIRDSSQVMSFIKTQSDSNQKQYEKKVLFLPLSCPKRVIKEIIEDDFFSREWDILLDKIVVDQLPSPKCLQIIKQLQKYHLFHELILPNQVTLTQQIIQQHTLSKIAISELFTQNSRGLIGMFESQRKENQKEDTTTITTNTENSQLLKRERRLSLIRMDYDKVSKGLGSKESIYKDNPNSVSTFDRNHLLEERGEKGLLTSSFVPARIIKENDLNNESLNTLEWNIQNSYYTTDPSYRNKRIRLLNIPLSEDFDFQRFYKAQTNYSTPEQTIRFHRIDSLLKAKKTRKEELLNMEEVIDTLSFEKLPLCSIFH